MAFVEDLTVFFSDFGVPATPSVGLSDITVIFDRSHMSGLGGDISGTQPIALAMSADVSSFKSRDTKLMVANVSYLVIDMLPDGNGLTTLVLEAIPVIGGA